MHHIRPAEPWHRLPKLHLSNYVEKTSPEVTLKKQLSDFHNYRVKHVREIDNASTNVNYGAAGVSFLSGV